MNDIFSDENLKYFDHPSEVWDSRAVRNVLRETWTEWISMRIWRVFLTLTFRKEIYPETALKLFKYLVRILNEEVYGKHYTNYVRHSYFSYVASIEYQKRDVIHFHVLIDRPVNFEAIHKYWNEWAGFAKVEIVKQNENVIHYLTKYIAKCGEMGLPWFTKKTYTPGILPTWWKEQEDERVENNDQKNILL